MSCQDFQLLLNRDLDGILGTEDQRRLSAHVAGCPQCSSHQASLHAISGAFRDLRHVDVRPGLADQIVERARAPRASILRISPHALIPAAAAVLALCLISGALGWRLNEPNVVQAHTRLDEPKYRAFLVDQLAVPEERVDVILKLRRTFDQRFSSEEADLEARIEKLKQQEVAEIWKLLPPDARERYRKHDPTFIPPETPR